MVDISGGLKVQLDEALKRAQALYRNGQVDLAAQEYERSARIMKELVADAVSPEVQRQRLDKAKQYLELAKRLRAGEKVAVTSEERAQAAKDKQVCARVGASEKEADEGLSTAILSLIQKTGVTWNEIGGLEETKADIRAAFALAAASVPQGIRFKTSRNMLLYGPSGTGKTLMAAAVSNELSATFFSVKASSLLSSLYGQSSRMVSALFTEARRHAPSVIYVDEVDSLTPSRSGHVDGPDKRLLSTLLSEMDGLESKSSTSFLSVIGGTNLPWDIDVAIRSRFGRLVYVPLPDEAARRAILAIHLDRNGFVCEIARDDLVRKTEGYSGRDIEKACGEATFLMACAANTSLVNEVGKGTEAQRELRVRPIRADEMEQALLRIRPQTDAKTITRYEAWARGEYL